MIYIEGIIKETMDKYASIIRNENDLLKALEIIKELEEILNEEEILSKKYFELKDMTTVSLLILEGALNRKQSLGSHFII